MASQRNEYSHLAEEIVELVLSKIHRLPKEDPNLVVIAAVEAIAWIAATETNNYCRENNEDGEKAMERVAEYSRVFAARAQCDLTQNFKS